MKKIISILIICLTLVTGLSSCAKKTYPAFNIKKESFFFFKLRTHFPTEVKLNTSRE